MIQIVSCVNTSDATDNTFVLVRKTTMIDREIHHRNIYWMRTLFVRTHATSSSYAPTLSRCLSVTGRNRFNGKHWQNCGATITKLVKAIAKFSHAHLRSQCSPLCHCFPIEHHCDTGPRGMWLRVARNRLCVRVEYELRRAGQILLIRA